jgi:small-conductance mechanosensitive channel
MMLISTAIGGGMQLFGGLGQAKASKRNAQIEQQIATQERAQNALRRQSMELDANRKKIENIRNVQLSRAMAMNTAVAQGAQFGSGLAGGLAQITGRGNWNELGINQNLQIGQNMFNIDDQISNLKMQKAEVGGDMATAQGISSLGGSIMKVAGSFSSLAGGFGGEAASGGSSYRSPSWATTTGGMY